MLRTTAALRLLVDVLGCWVLGLGFGVCLGVGVDLGFALGNGSGFDLGWFWV